MKSRREFVSHSLSLAAGVSLLGRASIARAAPGVAQYVVPLTMTDMRVAMSGTIGGKGPFLFAIDTGGQLSLMDKATADALGLPKVRDAILGIGGRRTVYPIRLAKDVVFAGQFRQNEVAFAETEHVRLGEGVAASVASGMLTSVDTELDFKAAELRFYPDGAPPRSGWTAMPNAVVPAAVNGLSPLLKATARFGDRIVRAIVDTGAPRGLIVRENLFAQLPTGANWSPAFKDGKHVARTARLRGTFSFGGLALDNPVVAAKQEMALFGEDVIIGLDVLRRLDLAIEARSRTLFLRPNGLPPSPPRYNMSGVWVDRDGANVVVGAVGEGSPAEAAGIRVGDRITNLPFQPLIAALNGPAGRTVQLDIERGGQRRSATIILADYL